MLPKPVRTRPRDEKGRRPRVAVDLGDRLHDKVQAALEAMRRAGYSEITVSQFVRLALIEVSERILNDRD